MIIYASAAAGVLYNAFCFSVLWNLYILLEVEYLLFVVIYVNYLSKLNSQDNGTTINMTPCLPNYLDAIGSYLHVIEQFLKTDIHSYLV